MKKTRTDSVQKISGGVWQGFDHLTKLESSKGEVVLQGGQSKEALQICNHQGKNTRIW